MLMKKNKKIGRLIVNTILIVVLVAIIIMVCCNIVMNIQKSHGSRTPNIFGYASVCVQDNALSPDVKDGDFIVIQLTREVKEGDIITYIADNNVDYETKKIVKVVYDSNNQYVRQYIVATSDGAQSVVVPTRLYGKVCVNFSGLAPVVKFFNSVPGTSLLIALALIVIFYPDIIALFKRDKKKSSAEEGSASDSAEENKEEIKENNK